MTSTKSADTQESYLYLPKAYIAPINPTPSAVSPIPNARTSILSRFESYHGRPTYRVRIVYDPDAAGIHSDHTRGEEDGRVVVEEVDLSAILDYVSPLELERFENAQFKREKEAQIRAEAQKAERKKSGRGRPPKARTATIRPTVQVVITRKPPTVAYDSGDDQEDDEDNESAEDTEASHIHHSVERRQSIIAESEADTDDEEDELSVPSSSVKMSKFMTTSALPPNSPSKDGRKPRASRSISSMASLSSPSQQLRGESDLFNRPRGATSSASIESSVKPDHHQNKRLRLSKSSSLASESSHRREASHGRFKYTHKGSNRETDNAKYVTTDAESSSDESLEIEHQVEAIIQHQDLNGVRYYLVKWAGNEEAQDWYTAENLQGASDMVRKYNKRVGSK